MCFWPIYPLFTYYNHDPVYSMIDVDNACEAATCASLHTTCDPDWIHGKEMYDRRYMYHVPDTKTSHFYPCRLKTLGQIYLWWPYTVLRSNKVYVFTCRPIVFPITLNCDGVNFCLLLITTFNEITARAITIFGIANYHRLLEDDGRWVYNDVLISNYLNLMGVCLSALIAFAIL